MLKFWWKQILKFNSDDWSAVSAVCENVSVSNYRRRLCILSPGSFTSTSCTTWSRSLHRVILWPNYTLHSPVSSHKTVYWNTSVIFELFRIFCELSEVPLNLFDMLLLKDQRCICNKAFLFTWASLYSQYTHIHDNIYRDTNRASPLVLVLSWCKLWPEDSIHLLIWKWKMIQLHYNSDTQMFIICLRFHFFLGE